MWNYLHGSLHLYLIFGTKLKRILILEANEMILAKLTNTNFISAENPKLITTNLGIFVLYNNFLISTLRLNRVWGFREFDL